MTGAQHPPCMYHLDAETAPEPTERQVAMPHALSQGRLQPTRRTDTMHGLSTFSAAADMPARRICCDTLTGSWGPRGGGVDQHAARASIEVTLEAALPAPVEAPTSWACHHCMLIAADAAARPNELWRR